MHRLAGDCSRRLVGEKPREKPHSHRSCRKTKLKRKVEGTGFLHVPESSSGFIAFDKWTKSNAFKAPRQHSGTCSAIIP